MAAPPPGLAASNSVWGEPQQPAAAAAVASRDDFVDSLATGAATSASQPAPAASAGGAGGAAAASAGAGAPGGATGQPSHALGHAQQAQAAQQAQHAQAQHGAYGQGMAKPTFAQLGVPMGGYLYALRHDHDHIVRGLYTRMQVQAVLQQLWQHVAHWQVSRVSPLGLAFSVFVPLQRCVTFDGQFFVPNDVAIETTMLPHARPLW